MQTTNSNSVGTRRSCGTGSRSLVSTVQGQSPAERHPAHEDGHCWHATQPSDFRENTLRRAMGWTGNSVSVSADGFTAWTTLTQSSCCQDPRWVGRGAPAASPAAQRNEWRLNMERSLGYQPTQAVPPRGTEQPPTQHKDTRIITFLISADTKLGTIQKWWEKKCQAMFALLLESHPCFVMDYLG